MSRRAFCSDPANRSNAVWTPTNRRRPVPDPRPLNKCRQYRMAVNVVRKKEFSDT